MRSHWSKYNNNFGDILTPFLVQAMGYGVRWCGRGASGKLLAVGSILDRVKPRDVVWGSGLMRPEQRVTLPADVTVLAVRGPKTRAAVEGDVPEVYGDPGLLLPRFYTPTPMGSFSVGVIPHEAEKDIPPVDDPSVLWIDINAGIEPVLDAMASCDVILSSSLHGLIAADAYGIPSAWIRMSNRVHGGHFKFDDYYLGSGQEPRPSATWDAGLVRGIASEARQPPILDSEHLLTRFAAHYRTARRPSDLE